MVYKPSPKPDYAKSTLIKYSAIKTHMWGDEISGYVKDWIYVSNKHLHQIIFGLKPGSNFKHSQSFRTIFGADEFLYVLSGLLVLSNPKTGEIKRVEEGQSVFFEKDTWHHAFNYSNKELQVLEFFSPPPLTGTSGVYAKRKPFLKKYLYKRSILNNPLKKTHYKNSFKVLKDEDISWSLYGQKQQLLLGDIVNTKNLKIKIVKLKGFQKSPAISFKFHSCFFSLNNSLQVSINLSKSPRVLKYRDSVYLIKGDSLTIKNNSKKEASLIVCEGI